MIAIRKDQIGSIPVLNLALEEKAAQTLPAVFFVHGFTSAKEHNLHYAYYLAEKGYRVLMPDCLFHGQREEGFDEYQLSSKFWEIVLATIEEIGVLQAHYIQKGLIDENRLGMAGTSMGGIVTLGALTKYPWIKSAVSLMGCPSYVTLAKAQLDSLRRKGYTLPYTEEKLHSLMETLERYDLSLQPEVLEEKALFFWHGKQDTVVPYQPAFDFYETLSAAGHPQLRDLQFITDELAGHKVSREGVLKSVEWFFENL